MTEFDYKDMFAFLLIISIFAIMSFVVAFNFGREAQRSYDECCFRELNQTWGEEITYEVCRNRGKYDSWEETTNGVKIGCRIIG